MYRELANDASGPLGARDLRDGKQGRADDGPTATLRFRWPWRDYQSRVLGALDTHLENRRLHVVAAPGSGKTVLGLEVFRRFAEPTVVLSPTRTIRDQWVERLGDFLPEGDPFALPWKSRDLGDLRFFNSLTYQALHTRMRQAQAASEQSGAVEEGEAEELEAEVAGAGPSAGEIREVVDGFRRAGIRVLILDEAHHLRAEWWAALQEIVAGLDEVTLVSLTATPPYDVIGHEWSRYIELCGPIDEEISVPELVKAGTLCPHQDYVWLVRCAGGEAAQLQQHLRAVGYLLIELQKDDDFLADVAAHDWVRHPDLHLTALMRSPDAATAMAVFLHARGRAGEALMAQLDLGEADLPTLDATLWEHLLRHYLFGEGWPDDAACAKRRQELARRLRAEQLLWRRELNLADAGRQWPQLGLSGAKADACLAIHRLECRERGEALCQVILTDYIRDEDYRQVFQRDFPLGAWPIFHRLASGAAHSRLAGLALHTGRLTIVHETLVPVLDALCHAGTLQMREVPALPAFREVALRGGGRLTRALTRLLGEGRVQVLVGTRALLGEGWDAPRVNSLILASVVGSFMTTNQMRGRAIRVDRGRPDKVASIWHIGAFADLGDGRYDVRDLREMAQRFETFAGLAEHDAVIEGGLERLQPGFMVEGHFRFPIREKARNGVMARRLRRRGELPERWREALDRSRIGRILPAVRVPRPPRPKMFAFAGTLRVLLLQTLALTMMVLGQFAPWARLNHADGGWGAVLTALGITLALSLGPRTVRLAVLFLRFWPVDGAVRGMALAVREALCDAGLIAPDLRHVPIICTAHGGVWHLALSHGSFADRSLFADCVHQVLAPIDSPRYLIPRTGSLWGRRRVDYHAVPTVLGTHRDRAERFLRAWQAYVMPGELVYTRSDEGRADLIRARARAFANARAIHASRMDRWF